MVCPPSRAVEVDPLPPFGIELTGTADHQVVRLHGELDLAYAAPVRAALAGVAGAEVVVDLGDLRFIDACGLSALLAARREMAEQGRRLVLTGAGAQVRRVFELTGLGQLLADEELGGRRGGGPPSSADAGVEEQA